MSASKQLSEEGVQSTFDGGTDGGDADTQNISVSSGARSISVSDSHSSSGNGGELEEHRNMLLAGLLEDYIRTRAAEFLNTTTPNKNYTRQSHEVHSLARQLFNEASRKLSSNGILPEFATSDTAGSTRRQYLSALDGLVVGSQAPTANTLGPLNDLVRQASRLALVPHPANDLQLTLQPPVGPSHYQSSFQEVALLGKGGFGKVYQCFNPLDNTAYAVKKIQIPPKLGKRFRDGRLEELQHILREVQALATLDHPNIVRYHATWIEEPRQQSPTMDAQDLSRGTRSGRRRQLLLDSHPFSQKSEDLSESSLSVGVVFEEDGPSILGSNEQPAEGRQWSEELTPSCDTAETPSMSNTWDVFTDGKSYPGNTDKDRNVIDGTGYTLYIQMSLYPMTLAQYIAGSSDGKGSARHCFHLVPSLRLLRAIHAGLRYVHSKGYIHRDIKPGNIFLSAPELESQGGYCDLACNSCSCRKKADDVPPRWLNPRIGDFGLAAQLVHGKLPLSPSASNDHTTALDKPVGTAYYRPPPSRDANDEKVDMFALGVVLVEMLCPCDTVMERVDMLTKLQRGCIPSSLERGVENEGYSVGLVQEVVSLATAMVNPDPQKRWSNVQVDDAIESILGKCENADS
ncbi:kinase-like protein [Hypoxylon cercidicola]|nr:kinase-like protein [Hypoxylon cercidicola]